MLEVIYLQSLIAIHQSYLCELEKRIVNQTLKHQLASLSAKIYLSCFRPRNSEYFSASRSHHSEHFWQTLSLQNNRKIISWIARNIDREKQRTRAVCLFLGGTLERSIDKVNRDISTPIGLELGRQKKNLRRAPKMFSQRCLLQKLIICDDITPSPEHMEGMTLNRKSFRIRQKLRRCR